MGRHLYKKKSAKFNKNMDPVTIRRMEKIDGQKRNRSAAFNRRRIMGEDEQAVRGADNNDEVGLSARGKRAEKLARWKAHKELERRLENEKKGANVRPSFVVRKVKYEPQPFLFASGDLQPVADNQRITRSKSRNEAAIPRVNPRSQPQRLRPRTTVAAAATSAAKTRRRDDGITTNAVASASKSAAKSSKVPERQSFAPEGYQFVPGISFQSYGVETVPEVLREVDDNVVRQNPDADGSPIEVTGVVEEMKAEAVPELEESESTKSPAKVADVEEAKVEVVPESVWTPDYFRTKLRNETDNLTTLCAKWSDWKAKISLSENLRGKIDLVVGQSELLMAQRFKQFSELIDDCEFVRGEKKTTGTDLLGFWEMIYVQVEDVMTKFERLESIREKGWLEEDTPLKKKPAARKVTVSRPKKVSREAGDASRSRLAEFKNAARMQKQLTESVGETDELQFQPLSNDGDKPETKGETASELPVKNQLQPSADGRISPNEIPRRKSGRLLRSLTVESLVQMDKTSPVHLPSSGNDCKENSPVVVERRSLSVPRAASASRRFSLRRSVLLRGLSNSSSPPSDTESSQNGEIVANVRLSELFSPLRLENSVGTESIGDRQDFASPLPPKPREGRRRSTNLIRFSEMF